MGGGNGCGVWQDILRVGEEMDELGLEFTSSCRGVLGDGSDTKFWLDRWVDDRRLCDRFSRLFHLDMGKEGSVRDKEKWVNGSWHWMWEWRRSIKGRMKLDVRRGWGIQGQSVIKIDRGKGSSCGKWNSRNALEQVSVKKNHMPIAWSLVT
ncbi:hypothetical protein Tco_0736760 [Tanacetum coccineum]